MRRQDGFGLIDTLVAGLVVATITVVLANVFVSGFLTLRVADDNFRGDDDVQLVLLTLSRDVGGTTPSLVTVSGSGQQLTLGAASTSAGRFVRITYTYDPATGEVVRSVDEGGATPRTTTVAHSLKKGLTAPIFAFCASGAGCPSVAATLVFQVRGIDVTRTIKVAPRLGTTP